MYDDILSLWWSVWNWYALKNLELHIYTMHGILEYKKIVQSIDLQKFQKCTFCLITRLITCFLTKLQRPLCTHVDWL